MLQLIAAESHNLLLQFIAESWMSDIKSKIHNKLHFLLPSCKTDTSKSSHLMLEPETDQFLFS